MTMKRISSLVILSLFVACSKGKNSAIPFQASINQEFQANQAECDRNSSINQDITNPLQFPEGENYLIYNSDQVESIANNSELWKKNFKIVANIDFSKISRLSIGTNRTPFEGNLNGSYCTLSGLDINEDIVGLFAYANRASFKNILIENFSMEGEFSSALVAIANETEIEKVLIKNSLIKGKKAAGGIAGIVIDSKIRSVLTESLEVDSQTFSGSLVGRFITLNKENQSILEFFDSSANFVKADEGAGSLLGGSLGAIIKDGSSEGIVEGADYVGGAIGSATESNISRMNLNVKVNSVGNNVGDILGEDDNNTLSGIQLTKR